MRYEDEYDLVGAYEEYDPGYESELSDEPEEDFADLEFDSEMAEADDEDFDDED